MHFEHNSCLTETGRDDAKKGADMETLAQGEEVDIDLDDPSTADAALKIQAVFRGHKSRQGIKQKHKEDEAAVKIQAGFRGHQVRKSMKDVQSGEEGEEKQATVEDSNEFVEKVTENETAEETKDFEDPKYGEAATKIQAGFRGFKTREELKGRLSKDKLAEEPAEQVDGEESETAKEEEAAAVKIQASFRGHKARKEVETMKATQSDENVAQNADSLPGNLESCIVNVSLLKVFLILLSAGIKTDYRISCLLALYSPNLEVTTDKHNGIWILICN